MSASRDIDLVYLWVDGDDAAWQALKRQYMSPEQLAATSSDERWGDDTRYRQMNEIAYAVRAARKFAPWLRTIYLVVPDGQRPAAEIVAAENVRVIEQSTLLPAALIPTFCSPSIEPFIHRIPGLSEIFVYGNDDYLFWKQTPRDFFVEGERLRLRGYPVPRALAHVRKRQSGHMRIAHRTALMLYARGFSRVYMPEHCFHVFRRSTCEAVWRDLEAELTAAVEPKFRDDDVAVFWQMLVDAYEDRLHRPIHQLSLNLAHVSFASVEQSRLMHLLTWSRLRVLAKYPRHVVCFNTIPPRWHARMHQYFSAHLDAGAT